MHTRTHTRTPKILNSPCIIPTYYGNNIWDSIFYRVMDVLSINTNNKRTKSHYSEIIIWNNTYQKNCPSSLRLPYKRISLKEALVNKIIIYDENTKTYSINTRLKEENHHGIIKNGFREFVYATTVIFVKLALDIFYSNQTLRNILFCATVIGTFKGLVKNAFEVYAASKKEGTKMTFYSTFSICAQKCGIEVVSEIIAEIFVYLSKYNLLKQYVKGFFKCVFKHLVNWLKGSMVLLTFSELCFEVIKSGLRGHFRDLGFTIINAQMFIRLLFSLIASVFYAGIWTLFVEQAFIP